MWKRWTLPLCSFSKELGSALECEHEQIIKIQASLFSLNCGSWFSSQVYCSGSKHQQCWSCIVFGCMRPLLLLQHVTFDANCSIFNILMIENFSWFRNIDTWNDTKVYFVFSCPPLVGSTNLWLKASFPLYSGSKEECEFGSQHFYAQLYYTCDITPERCTMLWVLWQDELLYLSLFQCNLYCWLKQQKLFASYICLFASISIKLFNIHTLPI